MCGLFDGGVITGGGLGGKVRRSSLLRRMRRGGQEGAKGKGCEGGERSKTREEKISEML